MSKREKVLVAMSGGVDSSVAACLLLEKGYDVVGVFMRLGAERSDESSCEASSDGAQAACAKPDGRTPLPTLTGRPSKGCCSSADAADARLVAGRLGVPFYVLNFERDFDALIDYFADEYVEARTPNPCIKCNQWLKFGKLATYADTVGADLIATGHYAIVEHSGGRPRLRRATYLEKDQSYVLFGIRPDVLRRTLLPLGERTKDEVREHARRFGLALHDKPESQDICFVPDGDYARIVRSRRPDAMRPGGKIVHLDGRVLGEHQGVAHFTIGQRRGIGVAEGTPVYVTALDAAANTVFVGPREAVLSGIARVVRVVWQDAAPTGPLRADVKIRYQHVPAAASLDVVSADEVHVRFDERQSAVTPGQAAVFYQGDEVVGGGWIVRE